MIRRLWANDWFRAFIWALALLGLLHAFVLSFVVVRSTSMFATLRPGDLLLVERWATWTGLERGDIVVFRDPLKDGDSRWRRPLLVKRLVGMPGDTVELKQGRLLVNGEAGIEADLTFSHVVRLKQEADGSALFMRHRLPLELLQPGRGIQELPLNAALIKEMEGDADVVSITPMRLATGAPSHVFPFSPRYAWNGDDFGPLAIPRCGDTLRITVDNLPLYDRLISVYEGHRLGNSGNQLMMDGAPLDRYVVEQDYGFVLGDCRHFSADSRYWGFLPMDHIIGRAGPVLLSKGDE